MYVCLYAYRHIWLAYVGGWQTGSGLHYPKSRALGVRGVSRCVSTVISPDICIRKRRKINKAKSMPPIMFINLIM